MQIPKCCSINVVKRVLNGSRQVKYDYLERTEYFTTLFLLHCTLVQRDLFLKTALQQNSEL